MKIINLEKMSLTYSEIYATSLRSHSKILKGHNTPSPSSKYVMLIKKYPKQKPSSKIKKRRINSNSMQNSKVKLSKKPKKKTKSKQKLEESLKNERIKAKDDRNKTIEKSGENYYISKLNKNNNISIKGNYSERNDIKDDIKKFISYKRPVYNIFQNRKKYNYYSNLSKTYNNDYYQNCFDVYNLKKRAANFRDIINNKSNNIFNAFSPNNFNNDLISSKNIIDKKDYLKTQSYTNFYPIKYKSFIKANKLREEIEEITNTTKTELYRPFSNINQNNNELKNLIYEKEEKSNNNKDIINNNVNKNDNKLDDNNNDSICITHHFFDRSMRIPKRMKKYFYSSNISFKNENKNSLNKKEPIIPNKIKNKKNTFRKVSINANNFKTIRNDFNDINKYLNYNNILDNNINNNINNFNLYNYRNNLNKINSIDYEDKKLKNLLRKIPTSKRFKNKSYDLIDYIINLRKNNNKRNLFYTSNDEINNNFQCIYPVNECKALNKNNIF